MPYIKGVVHEVDFASFLGYYAYLSFYFSARGGHYLIQMKYGAMALLLASFLSALAFVLNADNDALPYVDTTLGQDVTAAVLNELQ